MPQISPISWISIILFFMLIVLCFKTNLPSLTLKKLEMPIMKSIPKKMKW